VKRLVRRGISFQREGKLRRRFELATERGYSISKDGRILFPAARTALTSAQKRIEHEIGKKRLQQRTGHIGN